jgi:hypothetical protein
MKLDDLLNEGMNLRPNPRTEVCRGFKEILLRLKTEVLCTNFTERRFSFFIFNSSSDRGFLFLDLRKVGRLLDESWIGCSNNSDENSGLRPLDQYAQEIVDLPGCDEENNWTRIDGWNEIDFFLGFCGSCLFSDDVAGQ